MPAMRVDHRLVAEQRLAAEGRDDVGDHAHGRQDHDVHGRVRVEPEQVLPQQRLAAAGAGVPVAEVQAAGRQEEAWC